MLHVCITATLTSCFTPILVMLQGRSISPVHRFLTKSGEWVWMQMCITLLYIPNTNKPYAATHLFRVIKYVSAWLLYTYKVSLCMCKPHDVGYCSYIAQNFGNRKLWRFTTNQPTFYLQKIYPSWFAVAKQLIFYVAIYQGFLPPKFCAIQYMYVHTYRRSCICIHSMKVLSDSIIAVFYGSVDFYSTKVFT